MSKRLSLRNFLRDSVILLLGVTLASLIFPGIQYDETADLIIVILVLFTFNLILKPILILFALPFVVFTFGLGIWLINAALFYLAGEWINGFEVNSFYTALGGAFVVSFTNILVNLFLNPNFKFVVNGSVNSRRKSSQSNRVNEKNKDQDVIDV